LVKDQGVSVLAALPQKREAWGWSAAHRPSIDLLNVSLHRDLRRTRDLRITKRPVGTHFVDEGFVYFVK
jgi:hypothetical protein